MIYEKFVRVLTINLNDHRIIIENREDLSKYLGGVGVASKLLEEHMDPDKDPLDECQPVVFAIGPLNGIYPVMTKTVAMFISPLTGELGESYAGGRLSMAMFNAGFDAVVIKGKSKKPCYIVINPNDVTIKDARALWGSVKNIASTIINMRESGTGKRSIIHVGIAGENQVSFASVCVDKYRHFGRLGLGAVLGSKNVKAITLIGGRDIPIKHYKEYFKTYREIMEKCQDTDLMSKYHDAGTAINIKPLNDAGGLPTLNMQQSNFSEADKVSGESFSNNHLVRKMACAGCPVGCIHIGQFRKTFAYDGYEYESVSVGYDYELIYALGTFLGIGNPKEILELIDEVEESGLDAMSTGVALGYATEALEKGLISLEETLVPLKFGEYENYKIAITNIATKKNKFYANLGKGVKYASFVYGGEDFAMQIAGNEMPGYHTGYGSLVGAAVGARHSHLCNGGYALDQGLQSFDEDEMVSKLLAEEIERCMLNSLTMCLFARKVYDRETIIKAFNSIGVEMTNELLSEIALNTYKTKLRIKKALGFNLKAISFPKRYFQTSSLNGVLDEEVANRMVFKYQEKINEIMRGE